MFRASQNRKHLNSSRETAAAVVLFRSFQSTMVWGRIDFAKASTSDDGRWYSCWLPLGGWIVRSWGWQFWGTSTRPFAILQRKTSLFFSYVQPGGSPIQVLILRYSLSFTPLPTPTHTHTNFKNQAIFLVQTSVRRIIYYLPRIAHFYRN